MANNSQTHNIDQIHIQRSGYSSILIIKIHTRKAMWLGFTDNVRIYSIIYTT